jgi:hypothetical protein
MTFDTLRQRVLLFGGYNENLPAFGDTWAWNGTEWTQEQDAGPSGRLDHKLVYDSLRDRVVLFGGSTVYSYTVEEGNWFTGHTYRTVTGSTYLGDTWEYNGLQWEVAADTGPVARAGYGLIWSSTEVWLFGGQGSGGFFGDTWSWDGKHWTQRQDIGPGARAWLSMTFDSARKRGVLYGGTNGNSAFGDTWEVFERPASEVE